MAIGPGPNLCLVTLATGAITAVQPATTSPVAQPAAGQSWMVAPMASQTPVAGWFWNGGSPAPTLGGSVGP
jgi:hypothetical protein